MNIFVLGNGKSRLAVDYTVLRQYGKVYGCNALYREFSPDVLVAVDAKMALEINESKFQYHTPVWTNINSKLAETQNFKFINPRLGWSSGPTALYLAVKEAPTSIYMLGFDFIGDEQKTNNVYAGTKNYKKITDAAPDHSNWEFQTIQVIKNNPHVLFYRVVTESYRYSINTKLNNYREISVADFNNLCHDWKNA